MTETIYSCDRCKKKVESGEGLFTVIPTTTARPRAASDGYVYYSAPLAVCRGCAIKVGLLVKREMEEPTPAMIQDRLYDLIYEIAEEAAIAAIEA